jgi:glycosyltransferase involved in cell wall biosynthesis
MRVVHVGNLCNVAFANCRALRQAGVEAELVITYKHRQAGGSPCLPVTEDPRTLGARDDEWPWIHWLQVRPRWRPFVEQRRLLAGYDVVHSYTLAPVFTQFVARNHICHCTGSDLRETAISRGLLGVLLRRAYRNSATVLYTDPDEPTLAAVSSLKLAQARFVGTIVDAAVFFPGSEPALRRQYLRASEDRLVFAPARQQWSVKGNDLLLLAFRELLSVRPETRLVARSWGPDAVRAARLAGQLGIEGSVTFVGELGPADMARHYRAADVVAGYFVGPGSGVPHFPLIVQEPLMCARPMVTHCDAGVASQCFGGDPPFWVARQPGEIAAQLALALRGGDGAQQRVAAAYRWATAHLSAAGVATELAATYRKLAPA